MESYSNVARGGDGALREAIVAGIFYPAGRRELESRIASLLAAARPSVSGCPAIISPHGSLDYSGSIAAAAWKAAGTDAIDTIVVVSPSHRRFEKGIFFPESSRFQIPGSQFLTDEELISELAHCSTETRIDDIPHLEEHAIEMQLIFAGALAPRVRILPVIMSCECASSDFFDHLHNALAALGRKFLVVLSSNMAVDRSPIRCFGTTEEIAGSIVAKDTEKIAEYATRKGNSCGASIIAAYIGSRAGKAMEPHHLGTTTSAAHADSGESIVGYSAFGFLGGRGAA